MTDVIRRNRAQLLHLTLFSIIALLVGSDLVVDYQSGTSVGHVFFEAAVLFCAVAGVVVLGRRLFAVRREARREARQLRSELASTRADARRWRHEARQYLQGLGEAIEQQFHRWELTPAEREVALLVLKGLSHREIAAVRGVSERTARQQAHDVYKKADLRGRAELSAFFLEDLLLPAEAADGAEGAHSQSFEALDDVS